MSKSNENNQKVVVIPLGSPDADKNIPGFTIDKKMILKLASLINNDALAASDTDFVQLSLMKWVDGGGGDVEVAEIDTRAAHEGALVALVGSSLNIVSGQEELGAGSYYVKYNETDSGTAVALTDAVLALQMHQK